MRPTGIFTNDLYRIENKKNGYNNLYYYFWFSSFIDKKTKIKLIKTWEKEHNRKAQITYKIALDYTTLKHLVLTTVDTGIPAYGIS